MEDKTATETQTTAISLNDLQMLVNIIDVCTKRGAFQGDELLPVGQVREKLAAFIKMNTPDVEEETEATTEATEATE